VGEKWEITIIHFSRGRFSCNVTKFRWVDLKPRGYPRRFRGLIKKEALGRPKAKINRPGSETNVGKFE